jgi:outer membrane protein insertion porin family/translocation and assembly module TamA
VRVQVEEGTPVRVRRVGLLPEGTPLPPELLEKLRGKLEAEPGARFDESTLDADEASLKRVLLDLGYARATVKAEVTVDRVGHVADVSYHVTPGPLCRFGRVTLQGQQDLDSKVILDVASIPTGKPFSQTELSDAERAVYALGTFTAVRAEIAKADPNDPVVDVVLHLTPGRRRTFRIGVGVMSGVQTVGVTDELSAVPEWDVHLRASYRDDDFLGGMRRLRIEDRPRLIMLDSFPGLTKGDPHLGNMVDVKLEQPRFIEHRTVGFVNGNWDVGPDPFFGFFRHSVSSELGVKRAFFGQRLQVSLGAAHDYYYITSDSHPPDVSDYRLPFVDEQVKLDLRNDAQRPRRGFYAASSMQQALRLGGYGSWTYTRWLPEVRFYEPLPWRIVLAQRLAFGALFVQSHDSALDPTSAALGPQQYRLRGGGSNSNRGFAPGRLGDGVDGGTRRWEGSFEVRVPLGGDFGFVLFFDAGDVSRAPRVRLSHLNAATGFGLRYFSGFVPVRLDLGWRIPGWQVIGGNEPKVDVGVLPSAAHLTIGEAF